MNENLIRLESLPNEILSDIFEYLDARDLYRAFSHQNFRFNCLLKSLNQLTLILSIWDRDEVTADAIFLPYIHTLIIKYRTDVQFNQSPNIRQLILSSFTYNRTYKLETVVLPYLEYLSINLKGSSSNFSMTRLHQSIFSNGFPCLKVCSLPRISPIEKSDRWTQLPSLRILRVGHIGLFTYIAILSTCPNLYSFHFFEEKVMQTSVVLTQFVHHSHLKRLVIKEKYLGPISHVGVLNEYLSSVPHLEYLSIHGTTYDIRNLKYLLEFDWFASIISIQLSLLSQLNFHLPIFRRKRIDKQYDEKIFRQLDERFKLSHVNRYRSNLIENRKNWKYRIDSDSSDE